jgi:hypothetical protein
MIFLPPELLNKNPLNEWFGDDNPLNQDDPGLIDVSMVEEEPYNSGYSAYNDSGGFFLPRHRENYPNLKYDDERGHLYNWGMGIGNLGAGLMDDLVNVGQHGLFDTVEDMIKYETGSLNVDPSSEEYDTYRSNLDHGVAVSKDGERLLAGRDPRKTIDITKKVNVGTKEDPVWEYKIETIENPQYNVDPEYQNEWFGRVTGENAKNKSAVAAYNDLIADSDQNQIAWEMQKDRKRQDERDAAERKREGLLSFADSISDLFKDRDYGHVESQFKQFQDV